MKYKKNKINLLTFFDLEFIRSEQYKALITSAEFLMLSLFANLSIFFKCKFEDLFGLESENNVELVPKTGIFSVSRLFSCVVILFFALTDNNLLEFKKNVEN